MPYLKIAELEDGLFYYNFIVQRYSRWLCGGTGTEVTLPTNTVQVPITTGTVTDSGSECTGFIG